MGSYLVRRILYTIPTVFFISIIVFIIIQLPPGSWVDNYVAQLAREGQAVSEQYLEALKARYGIDKPIHIRYWRWVRGWARLDFGRSFMWNAPVLDLVWERFAATVIISLASMFFIYAVSIPIAVYGATHQYSLGDNIATLFGFAGLAVPNFMLALVLMYIFYTRFGIVPGGLVSPAFQNEPWSFAKFVDVVNHLWVPMIVIGTGGTASTIRVLRATILDELGKDYVDVARAKGLPEKVVIYRHVLRVAINPLISRIVWELPQVISGSTIVAQVLSLPILGALLLSSLQSQDMYLAGTIILFQSVLVVIGGLLSDILLALSDPRIRYE
ncbi:MAG: ABC transporter permease [Limnochordia bacterium]|jgi:peptide/nickel transport system permease protein